MKVKLIGGGSEDGKFVDVRHDCPYVEFAVRERRPIMTYSQMNLPEYEPTFEFERYIIHRVGDKYVGVIEGMTLTEAVQRAFNYYGD